MAFSALIQARLKQHQQQGLLRERVCVEQNHQGILSTTQGHYVDFASNDYLGLREHPDVTQAWVSGVALYGSGSGASPLVTGYMKPHQELEAMIASSLRRDAALLFSSGFAANQALCRALFAQGGNVLCDKFMHASFIDGALASEAQFKRFKHNDNQHLANLLSKVDTSQPTLIATEGVFSMDGDSPDISTLCKLAREHNAWVMLDEAHSIGVLDQKAGLGCVGEYKLSQHDVPIVMGTFGKALGTSGAFITGSSELIAYLVNFARDYVYSTAMPPAQAYATQTAWQIMMKGEATQALHNNITQFQLLAQQNNIPLQPSNSAIQWISIGQPNKTLEFSHRLKQLGIWVGAMRSPTVPVGTDRLRITLSASHTPQDIQALVDGLNLVLSGNDQQHDQQHDQ